MDYYQLFEGEMVSFIGRILSLSSLKVIKNRSSLKKKGTGDRNLLTKILKKTFPFPDLARI